jgi:hypothetical protein
VATLGMASGQAFASSSVSCTGLKGTETGTITISKCSPSGGKGYKSASGASVSLATGGNITWSNSGATTTIGDTNVSSPGQGSCPKKQTEYEYTGTVTAASTSGTGIPKVNDSVSGEVCVASSGKITLVKGTTLDL